MVNVRELIKNIKGTKSPYECPLCQKIYKSYSGIEYHLLKFPHDGVERRSSAATPTSKRSKTKKGRGRTKNNKRASSPPPQPSVVRETLTYAQALKMVEFDFDGHLQRLDIGDSVSICEEPVSEQNGLSDEPDGSSAKSTTKTKSKSKNKSNSNSAADPFTALPKPEFRQDDDCGELDAPPRSTTYFRFIERTSEELDEEVEYSADDEDTKWLRLVNEQRKNDGLASVSQEVFEMLMDRLEKESHFESQNTCDSNQYIDEDAVCCICNDGECANSNVILFCDMCNLAVHQECYGVPYIPEGQWLCRRCLNSPSRPVDCVLCPNKTGAFKQTDDNRWAHVVCALWIPEVCFANTVFLEPIDSIQNIPPARWKLRCYICRRTQGACIQCFKTNCYTAFHVTCAQQAGLYMKIEPIRSENGQVTVKKTAYCDGHSPGCNSQAANGSNQESEDEVEEKVTPGKGSTPQKPKSNKGLQEICKRLSEKHPTVPIVNIPFVPAHRLSKIVSRVAIQKKSLFIQRLQSYWMLKRQSRNGVPLLRRLQASHQNRASGPEDQQRRERIAAMKEQLYFWQRLRHDLERARLLVELIRKREKLKREHLKSHLNVMDLKLKPLTTVLSRTLDQLQAKDPGEIFLEPVDTGEVADYLDVITEPMDFTTMREKIEGNVYRSFDEFEHDFNLIWKNCMAYNAEDTIYYRAAVRLRDQGKPVVRSARRQVERTGVDPETGLLTPEVPTLKDREPTEEDFILTEEQRKDMSLEDQLTDLNEKLEMTQAIKHGSARAQRNRQLRKEIALLRRKINQQERKSLSDSSAGELYVEDGQSPDKKPKISPDRLSPIQETPSVVTTASDMSGTSLVTTSRTAEPAGTVQTASTTNPSPGTNRRSGILFNKNKFRARRNIQSQSSEKDFVQNSTPVFENGEDASHDSEKNGSGRRNSMANDSNEENNWGSINRLVFREDSQGNDWYLGRKTSRLNSYPEDVPPDIRGDVGTLRNNFKQNSRPKARNSRSNTSGSEDAESREKRTCEMLGCVKKRGRTARSRCNSEEDINTTDSECNGTLEIYTRESDNEPYVFEYLDLVWAKCRGYPSYPALIINPKTKRGFVHKGVPIPVPPEDVLKERRSTDEHLYLVLFFDARRTWQWLPRQKLELLGRNQKVDSTKLYEGKKPSLRKSVQQAFARALSYKEQISTRDDEVGNDFMDKDEDVEEDMREEEEEAGGDDDSS